MYAIRSYYAMMDCLEFNGLAPKPVVAAKVFVVMEDSTAENAMTDIGLLRRSGVSVIYSYKSGGFGKQFKEANQLGCEWVLVYGQ